MLQIRAETQVVSSLAKQGASGVCGAKGGAAADQFSTVERHGISRSRQILRTLSPSKCGGRFLAAPPPISPRAWRKKGLRDVTASLPASTSWPQADPRRVCFGQCSASRLRLEVRSRGQRARHVASASVDRSPVAGRCRAASWPASPAGSVGLEPTGTWGHSECGSTELNRASPGCALDRQMRFQDMVNTHVRRARL
jgi:hypothetical protein